MDEQASVLQSDGARREWPVRCTDNSADRAVCSVEANNGDVEIISPYQDVTVLEGSEIISFRDALNAAIGQAETDVLERSDPGV